MRHKMRTTSLRKIVQEELERVFSKKKTLNEAYVEGLLQEGAWTIDDLESHNAIIEIDRYMGKPNDFVIYAQTRNGNPLGFIQITRRENLNGSCAGAWIVAYSFSGSMKGLGPLLYDIAIEVAGALEPSGAGLASDRYQVSDDALSVWGYYNKVRKGEFEITQLDSLDDELTPGKPDDNCAQVSSSEAAEDAGVNWWETSISKAFKRKGTPTIDALKSRGLLRSKYF
jgi:hypothetical protein